MDPDSLFFWWPKLRDERMPKTVGVVFDWADAFPILDGDQCVGLPWLAFEGAAVSVKFPCFVRSDLASAKHSGIDAYRMGGLGEIWRVVHRTVEDNCLKNLENRVTGLVFRQWIELDGRFTAFGGHPIAPEVRIFPRDPQKSHRVEASYFYWPEEAFERHCDDPRWRKIRQEMETETMVSEVLHPLEDRAIEAVRAIGFGEWSVDFARDKNGDWWLIDMALAKDSWRPE
jgi:hypothetical protein